MLITQEIFEAFLKCRTKSHLIGHGVTIEGAAANLPQEPLEEVFRRDASVRLRANVAEGQVYLGTPPVGAIRRQIYSLIADCSLSTASLKAELHGLRLVRGTGRTDQSGYTPLRFLSNERLSITDRLLLAFDALVFSRFVGISPRFGEFIHGQDCRTTRVPLTALYDKVESVLTAIAAQQAQSSDPPLVLNKHCAECQYALRCGQIAKDADDLSLLSKMNEKERERLHRKGIFTVTQLSYTFRHRKHRSEPRHDHALKALAIRKNQIHVVGKVAWSDSGTPVYIDVEGDPDRGYYYCIGIRFEAAGSIVQSSYWADGPSDEERMWAECLVALNAIDEPRLIYYGSYETSFLRQMKKRYDVDPPSSKWGLSDKPCWAGVDASWTIDLTAVVFVFPPFDGGEIWTLLPFFWMPKEKVPEPEHVCHVPYSTWIEQGFIQATPGNAIDQRAVMERIRWGREKFELREMPYDRCSFRSEAMNLTDEGIQAVEITQSFLHLSHPTKFLLSAYVDQKIRHGNNPVFNWMASCLQLQYDHKDNCQPTKPERGKSAKRIDGIAATVTALTRALVAGPQTVATIEIW